MIVVLLAATFSTMRKIFFMEGLWPMISLNAIWEGVLMGMILLGVPFELLMGFFPGLTSQWLYGQISDTSFYCKSQILILDIVVAHP
jgi:hypothetical protein